MPPFSGLYKPNTKRSILNIEYALSEKGIRAYHSMIYIIY